MSQLLVAQDYSGSTYRSAFYHNTIAEYLKKYDSYDVVLWDDRLQIKTKAELQEIHRAQRGCGLTKPLRVAEYLHETQFSGNLILITDGLIDEEDVIELDRYLETHEIHVAHITCLLIQVRETERLDATVIAPFLRRIPHSVLLYHLSEPEPMSIVSGNLSETELIDQLKSITTVTEFQTRFDKIFSEVVNKMLGKIENLAIRDEILALQHRLMKDMKNCPPEFDMEAMKAAFADGNLPLMKQKALELHQLFCSKWDSPTWPQQIFHLIRMCTGSLGSVYSIHALGSKFDADRVRRADVIKSFELADIDTTEISENVYTCPITYEEERDIMILVKKPTNHLLKLTETNRDMVNSIITNPLMALKYPEFCKELLDLLDHPVSVKSMKEAERVGCPITISPITRSPVIGGICLAPCEDHSKATDSVIAAITARGKQVGHRDLWFMLIWYLIERGDRPYLSELLPQIREHLVFRMKNHFGTFTLSNSPYIPVTVVPLGIAAWCTLCASEYGIPTETADLYLKPHLGHLSVLRKALDLMKYPVPASVDEHITNFSICTRVQWMVEGNRMSQLPWLMRSAYRVIEIDTTNVHNGKLTTMECIPVDDNDPEQKDIDKVLEHVAPEFQKTTINQRRLILDCLMNRRLLTAGELSSGINFPGVNWGYGLKRFDIPAVPICPGTCRPYTHPKDGLHWTTVSESCFGPIDKQIRIHKYYIDYVCQYHKYPTRDELLLYAYDKVDQRTLPHMISEFVDCAITGYSQVTKDLPVEQFIRITNRSMSLQRREHYE